MHVCHQCSRVNPADAMYCFFDGVALSRASGRGGAAVAAPLALQSFSQPFTFPTGPTCRNFDQLALGCHENWSAALDVLRQGHLERFLSAQGRADLAQAAREAARFPDRDRGLDQFLARLPSQAVRAPKLRVDPTAINLGTLHVGEDRKFDLNLENQGMRLLYGSVTVVDAPWLFVGKGGARQKLFQFGSELTMPVWISGKRLRAGNKPLEGKLLIESSGGDPIAIPVKAEVPVKPYPNDVLAGARSPRQVAEKAKAHPKEAAVLFEKGLVAQWYKENGWQYPVRGPAASGLGAVQQFFEALGLTPPPRVAVGEKQVHLQSEPGQAVQHQLEVKCEEKRPVYAHAVSDQPWLEVGRARLSGRVAAIPLRVSSVPGRSGETLHAKLTVTANGNQRFVIPVTLRVGQANSFMPLLPVATGRAPLVTAPKRPRSFAGLQLLPAILLAAALFLVILWDLFDDRSIIEGWPPTVRPPGGGGAGTTPVRPKALSEELYIAAQFTEHSSRFGISCNFLKDPNNQEERKRLTRDARGMTNNTCFRVDGYEYLFGNQAHSGLRWVRERGLLIKEAPIPVGVYHTPVAKDRGWRSMMDHEMHRVRITQDVEIVVGESSLLYDTALITYLVTNNDQTAHTIGLRVMLDTFVGADDGVPIHVPAHGDTSNPKPAHFINGMEIFPQKDIPDYLMAVEKGDLAARDSTVAVMGLRLGGFEVPEKLVVCRWPQNSEARWGGTKKLGDWDYERMDANPKVPDSCVVLYWGELRMNPGETRKLGFTYGLGRIAGAKDGNEQIVDREAGQLRLFVNTPRYQEPFPVTAHIKTKKAGEKITLALPKDVSFAPGQPAEQPVPPPGPAGYSAVTWKIIAASHGEHELQATVPSIGTAKVTVPIRQNSLFNTNRR